jgi:RNA polymerase sigma-70 factor (ECF subfamily)
MDGLPFDEWYRTEHPKLLRVLVVVAGSPAEAAEVVDEAFARAYERWERVSQMRSPTGWTYRTALNLVRRRGRRVAVESLLHRRSAEQRLWPSPPADWSPEVWDGLMALPDRERTAIALRYVADLSVQDIAVTMAIAPGTVGSTLHSARRHLAALLGDEQPVVPVIDLEVRDA